jgi:hypothetical protein
LVSSPRFLQGEDETHQLLGGVGYGDIIMLSLGTLLSKVCGKMFSVK